METLHCRIYSNSTEQKSEMMKQINLSINGELNRNSIEFENGELYLDDNDDYDTQLNASFPDGFIYFRYTIDIEYNADLKSAVNMVNKLLEFLWSNNLPSVAACDFETELTKLGGYNSSLVPWI